MSAGGEHTCGITTSGAAYCWGYGKYGSLGNGLTDGQTTPVAVSAGLTFASVSAGHFHNCGVTTGAAAYCWGFGRAGRLGNGLTVDQATPVAVSGGLTFASVSAGSNHTCGVTTGGSAYCWGWGGAGEGGKLGAGAIERQLTPVAVLGGLTFAAVSTGFRHTCGVTTSGAGRLGDGSGENPTTPVAVSGGLTFAAVIAYFGHTCGVTTSGAAYCWGGSDSGKLGDGSGKHQFTPAAVAPPAGGISTPTPQPTLNPTPTQVPVPGDNYDNALAIELDEAASFSITLGSSHFYEVQLEEGITYTIYVSLDNLEYSVVTLTDSQGGTLDYKISFPGSDAGIIVWTATRSGSYFVDVTALRDSGSYALTVTEGDIPRPPPILHLHRGERG